MSKTIHCHINVRTGIKCPSRFKPFFPGKDKEQIQSFFMDKLAKGQEVIPVGNCDNFDYSGGACMGHEIADEEKQNGGVFLRAG
jgi:hypothetical protein